MSMENLDPVKLLVTFSYDANLDEIIATLTQSYLFIQNVKKHKKNQLMVSFESVSDLLEIDFVDQFGAISTKVKNSYSFCKEMNEDHQISTEDAVSSNNFISHKHRINRSSSENPIKRRGTLAKCLRLTSLQDELTEEEEVIKQFALFDEVDVYPKIDEQKFDHQSSLDKEQINFQQEAEETKLKSSIWTSLISSVILTSLFFGGVKAIKFFIA